MRQTLIRVLVYTVYQLRRQVYRTIAGGASAGIPCSLSVFCVVGRSASEKTDCTRYGRVLAQ
jgi:heme O synthase-like polyprenyltransferase